MEITILGLYRVQVQDLGFFVDNGQENGNYCTGVIQGSGLGFRIFWC